VSECVFLTKEWVKRVVAAIEHAKLTDEEVRSLASDFSLSVAYIINDLPEKLGEQYGRKVVYVELNHGTTTCFTVGTDIPAGKKPDYVVESSYGVAKSIFQGELNPGTAFVKRLVKVRPLMKLYTNPAFTAKSLVTFNLLLNVMRNISTVYPV